MKWSLRSKSNVKVGASYYPELSSPATWESDLRTVRDIGLCVLRCGEFAWSRLSPEPGAWDTRWARGFLDVAHALGFRIIWCTPSATPPPFLFDQWPDLHAVTHEGEEVPVGVRRQYCPAHEGYRALCADTAARLATDLGNHPAVIGWQVDNELAGCGFTCWCPRCGGEFQRWLMQRYGTLDALNAAWQTDVWAQRYSRWEQIPIPLKSFNHAPSLKLAWRRFFSAHWLGFFRTQADALRRAGGLQPITTNFYAISWMVPFDQWAWRPHLDAIGIGHYVDDVTATAFEMALLRGLDTKPLWVLEQKAGQQNAQNLYPEDLNRMKTHLRTCAEAGAEFAVYWHLRQHQSGCEMEHGAVLRHDGKPTRIAAKVRDAIAETVPIRARPRDVRRTLVFDFDQHWAQETRPHPGTPWEYCRTLEQDWFGALCDVGGNAEIGPFTDAMTHGTTVFLPHFQTVGDSEFRALENFLERGGVCITTADFGRLDRENNVRPLRPLAAFASMPDGEMLHLKSGFRVTGHLNAQPLSGGVFWFVPEGGSPVVHLTDGVFSSPAFLESRVGDGRLIVLLSAFDRASLATILNSTTPAG